MTLTAAQIRQARAMLGWSSAKLSRRAWLAFDKVLAAQGDGGIQALSDLDAGTLRTAFEAAGVVFEAGGRVRLRDGP